MNDRLEDKLLTLIILSKDKDVQRIFDMDKLNLLKDLMNRFETERERSISFRSVLEIVTVNKNCEDKYDMCLEAYEKSSRKGLLN